MSKAAIYQNPKEVLQLDLELIYIGNLNTVDEDLILPATGKYGSVFAWSTSDARFIDVDGTVHRPLHGMGNRKVWLTVKASYQGETAEKEFTAVVLQAEKETVVTKIRPVNITSVLGESAELPSVVIVWCADGRCTTMPVCWDSYVALSERGTVTVLGIVKGTELKAEAIIEYRQKDGPDESIRIAELSEKNCPIKQCDYFSIEQIRLLPGTYFYEYRQRMLEYLLSVSEDSMLYNFRKAAGLNTRGAVPMTGWDADDCKLKGHTTGHYMSGLALAWSTTGDKRFQDKIRYMVDSLAECQEAFATSDQYHYGFLSAYSEEQFDLLEQFTCYPEIWAPYYTLDKIMSGLYDCYQLAGNAKALEILDKMGDWVWNRLSRLPKATLDTMWSMYIAGEFGGMQSTMAKLYRLTGKKEHLQAARLFHNEKLFYPMKENCDTLEDMHANQHIPQILGAMELYKTVGEMEDWKISKNFWDMVTGGHIYSNGGVGETEMFHGPDTTALYLTDRSAESCASYNMLRLTGQLFPYTMDGRMMDYYDNTLRNHILTSCSHTCDGGTTYFLPLRPGGQKEYSTVENTCCHGTGMESRFRYMEHIYAYDEQFVYVNLWIDSVLHGTENDDFLLRQETIKPEEIRIRIGSDFNKQLRLRLPSWVGGRYHVQVNGETAAIAAEHGYLTIPGFCKAGDEIRIHFPMELRLVEDCSDAGLVCLSFGPYLLAALSEEQDFIHLPELSSIEREGESLCFHSDTLRFIPLAQVDREKYHVYFQI